MLLMLLLLHNWHWQLCIRRPEIWVVVVLWLQGLADGKEIAIDYREMAPGKAHRDMYIDSAGEARTDKSQDGHLSSGVPGTVAGLFASAKYAKLSFDKLIQPAIDLAEKGFVISKREANSLNGLQDELKKYQYSNACICKRHRLERRRYIDTN